MHLETDTTPALRPESTGSIERPTTGRTLSFDGRAFARWIPTFLAFPLAGLVARAVAGNIDDLPSSLAGGAAAGAVIGAVQLLARLVPVRSATAWVLASAGGLAVGLSVGASVVGHRTDVSSLVVMGALSGLGLGLAQATAMRAGARRRVTWAVALSGLWALGWWITANVIVDAHRQHSNFGASGALVVTVLSGLVLATAPDRRLD